MKQHILQYKEELRNMPLLILLNKLDCKMKDRNYTQQAKELSVSMKLD